MQSTDAPATDTQAKLAGYALLLIAFAAMVVGGGCTTANQTGQTTFIPIYRSDSSDGSPPPNTPPQTSADEDQTESVGDAINKAPTAILCSTSSVHEGLHPGTIVGALQAKDPNPNDQHRFSLVPGNGDTDNHRFRIRNNELSLLESLDHEQTPMCSLRIAAVDDGGLELQQELVIQVEDGLLQWYPLDDRGNAPRSLNGIRSVHAGYHHSTAVGEDGRLIAWGRRQHNSPQLSALTDITQVAAGENFNLALQADGDLYYWHSTGSAQIFKMAEAVIDVDAGDEHFIYLTADGRVQVSDPSNPPPADLRNVIDVAAGFYHFMALTSDGEVVAWGYNGSGQTRVPTDLRDITAIEAGGANSAAVAADGTLWVWGFTDGRPRGSNIPAVHSVSIGYIFGAALTLDGRVITWGDGHYIPSMTTQTGYVQISAGRDHLLALRQDGSVHSWGSDDWGQSLGQDYRAVAQIEPGRYHTTVIERSGMLKSWGKNDYGQASAPPTQATKISAGRNHSLALLPDGTVQAWGINYRGSSVVPPALGDVVAVAAGHWHSLALTASQQTVGWGNHYQGQLVPQTEVVQIAAGYDHSLILHADGSVRALGDPTRSYNKVPAGLRDVVAIAAGYGNSLALTADGQVYGWGYHFGAGNSPGMENIVAIDMGDNHAVGLTAAGTLQTWGGQHIAEDLPVVHAISVGAYYTFVQAESRPLAEIVLPDLKVFADGKPQPHPASVLGTGAPITSLTYNGSPQAPSAPGTYRVRAVVDCHGWYGQAEAELTILPASNN